MLKSLVNEAHVRLNITTQGPLLIKSGYATPMGADMTPVQTYRNGHLEVYIPGSSLKGIFRSHSEKVINSLKRHTACNPLSSRNDPRDTGHLYRSFCGDRVKDKQSHEVYAQSCPTCRLFGSTSFVGRIAIGDAYLIQEREERKLIEHRDGIAIDRLTGGTGNGKKFDLDVVTQQTTFVTDIHLRNFEIWQLGLLFIVIQDMEDELIRIGSGRSRGLGKVSATISTQEDGAYKGGVMLSSTRHVPDKEPVNELWGLGRWLEEEHQTALYATQPNDVLLLAPSVTRNPRGVRNVRVFKDVEGAEGAENANLTKLRNDCFDAFVTRIQAWPDVQEATTNAPRRG